MISSVRFLLAVLFLAALSCGGSGTHTEGPVGRVTGGGLEPRDPGMAVQREPLGELAMVERRSESPIVTLRVSFDVGSAEDTPGREGITHLLAQLLVRGGAGDLSYGELTERLYPMAAELDVDVGRDQTVFVGRVHRDHLEAFYEVFRDVLARPRLAADDFERIKEQTKSALTLELRGNDDEELGKEALQGLMYESHPYGHPVLGTESGLVAIRVDDVRAHRNRVFCGARATVGLAGAYPEGFAERVRRDLTALDWDTCVGRRILPAAPRPTAPRMRIVHKPTASSVAISMGIPIDVHRGQEDFPALALAAAYLGQHRQFVGRLMQKMRGDRGLNYGDYAYVEHFDQEGWSRFPEPNQSRRQQYFSIWIRPVRPEQAHFALRMAVRELRLFVAEGLSEADFERVRTFADRYYALYLQTESRRLGFAIDDRYYGAEGAYLERLRSAWRELTAEEVNAAIQRHIDPNALSIAVVHPDAEAFRRVVAAETPSPIEYAAEKPEAILEEDREIVRYELGIPEERTGIVEVGVMFR